MAKNDEGRFFSSPNYTGQEMAIHAESTKWLSSERGTPMEFPPYPNDDEDDTVKVWNLFYIETNGGIASRPQVINFSTEKKLQVHAMEMVLMNKLLEQNRLDKLNQLFVEYKKQYKKEAFTEFMLVFRKAQLENKVPVGFDIFWDDAPQALL